MPTIPLKHSYESRWKRIFNILFPASLWSRRFLLSFLGCWCTLLYFDYLWCSFPNSKPLFYAAAYTSSATLALILATPSFIKGKGYWLLGIMIAVDIFLIANLLYCRTYASEIPPSSYLLLSNLSEFKSAVASSFWWQDLFFPVISVSTWLLIKNIPSVFSHETLSRWSITLIIGILITVCLSLRYGGMINHIATMRLNPAEHHGAGIVYTLPVAILQHNVESRQTVSNKRQAQAVDFIMIHNSLSKPASTLLPSRKNLIMIIVESLESWIINGSLQGQYITPNLNRMVADSTTWYAQRVFSQAGRGRSIDGQLLVTSGIYPTSNPVFSYGYPDNSYPSLARELKNAFGSHSYLLTSSNPVLWNQVKIAEACGIETQMHSYFWEKEGEYFKHEWFQAISDESFFNQIINRINNGEIWSENEPVMMEIVTITTHFPFYIPDEKKGLS